MRRKYRNFALLLLMVGSFGVAADGCAACNFAAPEYELLSLVVNYTNRTKQNVHISGPGETPAFAPLQAPGNTRVKNLGQVFDGQTLTFELYNESFVLKETLKCQVEEALDFKNALVYAFGSTIDSIFISAAGKQLFCDEPDDTANALRKRTERLTFGPKPPVK